MKVFNIEENEKNLLVKIVSEEDLSSILPEDFSIQIEKILEENKDKEILIDASSLPEFGVVGDADFGRTRLDALVCLTEQYPHVRVMTKKATYNRWVEWTPQEIEGNENGYKIISTQPYQKV